jgi:putative DNA primase/helicase
VPTVPTSGVRTQPDSLNTCDPAGDGRTEPPPQADGRAEPPEWLDIEPPRARGKRDGDAAHIAMVTRWAMIAGFWVTIIAPKGVIIPYKDGPQEAEGKEPLGKAWGAKRMTASRMRYWRELYPAAGVGMCFGPGRAPGGWWLIDLEIDGEGGEESLLALLGGEIVATFGWSSARGAHRVFIADGERLLSLLAAAGAIARKGRQVGVWHLDAFPGLEWRVGGYKPNGEVLQVQSVCPPTLGTDGLPREFNGCWRIAALPECSYGFLEDFAERRAIQEEMDGPEANGDGEPLRKPATRRSGGRRQQQPPGRAYALSALESECKAVESAQVGDRNNRLNGAAFNLGTLIGGGGPLDRSEAERGLWAAARSAGLDDGEIGKTIASGLDAGIASPRDLSAVGGGPPTPSDNGDDHDGDGDDGDDDGGGRKRLPDLDPELSRQLSIFNRTDLGNGERLATRYRDRIRYCHKWSKWLAWDGRRWAMDDMAIVDGFAKMTVRMMLCEAATIANKKERLNHLKWQTASECRKLINAMIALAAREEGIPILPDDMNRDGWLLNCPNGTIDLRTGRLREHRREDLITQLCPTRFDPDAKCPLWDQTIDLFLAGDAELIGYWRKVCGYCLPGIVRDHLLPIAYGRGSNGKSTILGTLIEMLGRDYAMKCPPDMLMAKKNETHPTDRADLFGKRLAVAIETESGRRLNETMVKELTGGDHIRARRMREDFWEFPPTHTLLMATNHKPLIRGNDNGIWRRLKLIPFTVSVTGKRAIKDMPERLRAEFPGILAWCVRGCLEWQKDGLDEPKGVRNATGDYRKEQDRLGAFLEENTIGDVNGKVQAGELYTRYKNWAERSNEFVMTLTAFGTEMQERGFEEPKKSGGYKWYSGIKLRGVYA